jgi:hypothetical protein
MKLKRGSILLLRTDDACRVCRRSVVNLRAGLSYQSTPNPFMGLLIGYPRGWRILTACHSSLSRVSQAYGILREQLRELRC